MDFRLTDEQLAIRDTVRRFVLRECPRDVARELDEAGRFPAELLGKLAATGFCALNNSEAYGGGDRNLLGAAIVAEELAVLSPVLAGAYTRVAFCGGRALADLGSAEQQQRWLPAVADGRLLFTSALGEPAAGDDPTEVRTVATAQGDGYALDGSKSFVALAERADYVLVLARTSLATEAEAGLTIFVVNARADGVRVDAAPQVGFQGASPGAVSFTRVRAAPDDILGGPSALNGGREQARRLLAIEQVETAALALGIAQGAYEYAARYARERVQFGQPIVQFEAIQHLLVELAMELRACRLLLYHACWLADQARPYALEAAIAQARAVDLARQAGLRCVHILGGYGFMLEYDAQRYMRDALALLAGSEALEVLKTSVGRLLGLAEGAEAEVVGYGQRFD